MKNYIFVSKLSLTQIICAQLCLLFGSYNCQNLPISQQLANGLFNGYSPGNTPQAESNVKANGLRIVTTLPLVDGFFNNDKTANLLPHSNVFQISNDFPAGNVMYNNAAAVNNLVESVANTIPKNNLQSFSNNWQFNNLPINAANGLPIANNLAINGLTLSNKVMNNEIQTNGFFNANGAFNNVPNVNVAGVANFQNVISNGPKMLRNILSNGAKNVSPFDNVRQIPGVNNEPVLLDNNGQINNGLPVNGLKVKSGVLTPQLSNAPVAINELSKNNGLLNILSNFNKAQSGNTLAVSSNLPSNILSSATPNVQNSNMQTLQNLLNGVSMVANVPTNLPVPSLPAVNTAPISQINCQNGLSFLTNLPTGNLQIGSLPGNYNLPASNLQAGKSMINSFGQNSLVDNILSNSLANLNLLYLGDSGSYPILNGLPIIGISESVTVLNPL